ncbi:hypothetical protein PIB30_059141 [Stylosanthes scabra]|uniref:Replication protein A 70 kDa DNA-binding subunit B/D first OB fold domain-containing protein n=1 Tax=Stylosanthes scabra TaxID=79078 RepID=A0ABU6WK75_9FABA|nr:hypothetical protein [Stylosanthes scabra]
MSISYDMLSTLDDSIYTKAYNIKVRVLKTWSITHSELKYQKPMFDMVVMDNEGCRIQCSIRNPLRTFFEDDLREGNVNSILNFSLSSNDQKYKPTNHAFRIYFKTDTQMRIVNDVNFLDNIFHFVPNEVILSHNNA